MELIKTAREFRDYLRDTFAREISTWQVEEDVKIFITSKTDDVLVVMTIQGNRPEHVPPEDNVAIRLTECRTGFRADFFKAHNLSASYDRPLPGGETEYIWRWDNSEKEFELHFRSATGYGNICELLQAIPIIKFWEETK